MDRWQEWINYKIIIMLYILEIDCKRMIDDGYKFYLSENQVYLTKSVPTKYIKN
jgi:RNA:NAD 2'-phosphotransferase (TPT1/KptA family)